MISVQLADLNYAPEIAQQMLIKQQADAYVKAKEAIVESSVSIVEEVLERMKPLNLSSATQDKMVLNLLTVIASGNSTQPTLPLN